MLGLSISDIIASFCYFLGTWLVPKGTVGGFGPVFGASGNDATCNLSGFFTQFAVASPMYNGTLACYYLLRIYFNIQEHDLRKAEKYFHIIPISFAFCTALIALCFDMYGNVEWLCWIKPTSMETSAKRAFQWFQWAFLFGPIWICIAFQSVVMYLLFRKMRAFERAMNHYSFSSQRNQFKENIRARKEQETPSTNISTAETSDRNLPSFVEKKEYSKDVSRLSMGDEVSEIQNEGVDHDNYEDSDRKENKVTLDEEVGQGSKVVDENDEKDGESMVRIDDIGNSLGTISKVSLNVESNAPAQFDKSTPVPEEEKTEIEAYSAQGRRSVKFVNKEKGDHQGLMSEYRQDSFLPNLKEDDNENDGGGGDDDITGREKQSSILRVSGALNSIISRMSGRRRGSVSSSGSSREHKRNLYNSNRKSRTIAIQGMLYVCAFYITWLFPTIQRFTEFAGANFFAVQIIDSTLLPMQGFFNFFIYIRPQFVKYRENHKEDGFWKSLKEVILTSH